MWATECKRKRACETESATVRHPGQEGARARDGAWERAWNWVVKGGVASPRGRAGESGKAEEEDG